MIVDILVGDNERHVLLSGENGYYGCAQST